MTLLIVAHNEEKVIYQKLENAITLEYPVDLLEIVVTSDNSTDKTNEIVKKIIKTYPQRNIRLYEVKERKGKTNAQDEAVRTIESDIIVMTDANSMLDKYAIKKLVASFSSENIAYVTGRLQYINYNASWTSGSESTYWNLDLRMRDIESKIKTITGGNGALYAVRRKDYHFFDPILCHDGAMPKHYASLGKRAKFNKDAIAYEKAGESLEDEFSRKVRMNRNIISRVFLEGLKYLNVFKYGWFAYFYFGHRYCRNLLWLSHVILFISNVIILPHHWIFIVIMIFQAFFYVFASMRRIFHINCRIFNFPYYYFMTIMAQFIGVINNITGKAKPFWDKAESTR